jgi:hypothetical protein
MRYGGRAVVDVDAVVTCGHRRTGRSTFLIGFVGDEPRIFPSSPGLPDELTAGVMTARESRLAVRSEGKRGTQRFSAVCMPILDHAIELARASL